MSRVVWIGSLLGALGLAASMALPAATADYEKLPPDPAVVIQQLQALQVGIAKAVEIAQKEVGGVASSAMVERDSVPPAIMVDVYTAKFLSRVKIDATNAKILERKDTPRFPGDPVSGQWTELPSGLKYYELKLGDGPSPTSPKNAVAITYAAWLTDGTPVDNSSDHGESLVISPSKLVVGLDEGLRTMKVGGKRKLLLPYDLAYGVGGKPPTVPPKATLIIDVELVGLP